MAKARVGICTGILKKPYKIEIWWKHFSIECKKYLMIYLIRKRKEKLLHASTVYEIMKQRDYIKNVAVMHGVTK